MAQAFAALKGRGLSRAEPTWRVKAVIPARDWRTNPIPRLGAQCRGTGHQLAQTLAARGHRYDKYAHRFLNLQN